MRHLCWISVKDISIGGICVHVGDGVHETQVQGHDEAYRRSEHLKGPDEILRGHLPY